MAVGEKIKLAGNFYFKKADYVTAGVRYKKALRYLNKLHDGNVIEKGDEVEKKLLELELQCLLNR